MDTINKGFSASFIGGFNAWYSNGFRQLYRKRGLVRALELQI